MLDDFHNMREETMKATLKRTIPSSGLLFLIGYGWYWLAKGWSTEVMVIFFLTASSFMAVLDLTTHSLRERLTFALLQRVWDDLPRISIHMSRR